MPTSVMPDAGRVVYREQAGTVDAPAAGNSVYGAKIYFGDFGTFTPPTLAGGLPIQFDTATAARIGAVDSAAVADHTSSGGITGILKAILRDLRARVPVLGQALMSASVPVTIASNQSPLTLGGNVDLRVGGAAAAGGAGLTNASTLRVVWASDQPVPTGARTTVECNQATGIRAPYTTSSAAFALPALGASRAIRIDCTKGLLFEFGADSSVTVADDANAYRMFDDDRDYLVVPDGMTHIAIMGIEAGTAYIKAVNG
jgi:hypothetical protein